MTKWHNLTDTEKLTLIREGYIEGKSATEIGNELGATRNAILGVAYRHGLRKPCAADWTIEYGLEYRREALKHERALRSINRYGYERKLVFRVFPEEHLNNMRAKKRANLPNRAKDELTRHAVSLLNSIKTMSDGMIAKQLGYSVDLLYNWRNGKAKITEFSYQCVLDFMERVNE